MGLLDFWRNKDKPAIVNRVSDYGFSVSGGGITTATQTRETILETASVLGAVKVISEMVATTPINLKREYQENGLTLNKEATDHWAYYLLHPKFGKPNSWQTPIEFISGMLIHAILGKGALALKVIVNGQVRELIPVKSSDFIVETFNDYTVQYRVTFADGYQQTFTQDQVLFIKGPSLDGYVGISVLEKARKAVGIASSLEQQQYKMAATNGTPAGVLSVTGELPAERKMQLREAWQAAYGPNGTGGTAILDNGADYKSLSMTMADSQFIENRKFQIEEVARIFNIQPIFLGHNAGVNVDGIDAAMRFHVKSCLGPWFKRIEQCLNRDVLGNAKGIYFDFDENDLLRGDIKAMMDSFTKSLGAGGSAGIFSVNEVRYEFGLNPINEEWAIKPTEGGYSLSAGVDKIKEGISQISGDDKK